MPAPITNSESTLPYRADIDGLRAIAVIAVVVFHAFPELATSGFVGVDIFFVISGYLISSILWRGLQSHTLRLSVFYAHRIRRIFPALILVLTASFLWAWFHLLPIEFKLLGKHLLSASTFVSNFTLLNESGYFDAASETKPLLHLWSLGIEEQFYAIWPLILILAWRCHYSFIKVTIALIAASFLLNLWQANVIQNVNADFYSPLTRAWELFFGALLALGMLSNNSASTLNPSSVTQWEHRFQFLLINQQNNLSIAGLVLILISIFSIPKIIVYPGAWALLPVIGAIFLIATGPKTWIARRILSNRFLVAIGVISYPFYLWHWPLLSFAQIQLGQRPDLSIRAGLVLLALFLSAATYWGVEKFLRYPKTPRQAKWITSSLLAIMLGILIIGYKTQKDGFPIRYPKTVQELLSFDYNYQNRYTHNPSRTRMCDLGLDQVSDDFKNCPDEISSGQHKIFLWGDSHAGHLYPGLKERYGEQNIIQRSAGACAPNFEHGHAQVDSLNRCLGINTSATELIKKIHPQTVILASSWHLSQLHTLQVTISKLKSAGITDIWLIGPVPVWKTSLPKEVFLYSKAHAYAKPPQYQNEGLNEEFKQVDIELEKLALQEQIHYESPVKLMCNEMGCLTNLSSNGFTPPQWDSAHLTSEGSQFLVGQFRKIVPIKVNH